MEPSIIVDGNSTPAAAARCRRRYFNGAVDHRRRKPATRLRQADIGRQEASEVAMAVHALSKRTNWLLVDRGVLNLLDIARAVRRARAKVKELRLVVVDYIQLVQRPPRMSEHEAIDSIMGGLAALAKDEDIAVLVISQLNRKLEERDDKRATLQDLRGSGGLEEKAKVVVALYRGAEYSDDPRPDIDYDCSCPPGTPSSACHHRPDADEWKRLVQFLLLKNNNGPAGRVFGSFIGPTLQIQ
jgi:replicative DNA helicase